MQPTPPEKSIESIIKYFSIIYVLLIITGLLCNILFYRNFSIVITEYIDLGEALLLFTPLLTYEKTILLLVMLFPMVLGQKYFLRRLYGDPNQLQKLKFFLLILAVAFALSVIASGFLYIFSFKSKEFTNWSIASLVSGIIVAGVILFEFALLYVSDKLKLNISKIAIDILIIYIVCLCIFLRIQYEKIEQVDRRKGQHYFEISFNDNSPSIYSNSNLYYLGRTSNYLFIYSYPDKKTSVYNVGDIKKFTVGESELNH